jgi:biotin synthase-related radical SAM superfamily protein
LALAHRKARLISNGKILVPRGIRLPVLMSRSTAGPGAGGHSLFFKIGDSLVRLEVVREGSAPLVLGMDDVRDRGGAQEGGPYYILQRGKRIAEGVGLLQAGMHAPSQAFINVNNECLYRCAFCTLHSSKGVKGPSISRWVELISDALRNGRADAVAVTSGIKGSAGASTRDIVKLVKGIRRDFPSVPIGVEPYTTSPKDLALLKRAGADELKLNVQCATEALLKKVCPGLDWGGIWNALESGVGLFGNGRVCSNLIIGLGETDADVKRAVERLAVLGVAVNLRPLRLNAINMPALRKALGNEPRPVPQARLVRLALAQKKIFRKHGIDPSVFRTMCHRCTACDLEPMRDI